MTQEFVLSPDQCRMARGALKWTTKDLAAAAHIHANTVLRIEAGAREVERGTLMVVRHAFEQAGLVFIPESDAEGAGVRWKEPAAMRGQDGVHHDPERGT